MNFIDVWDTETFDRDLLTCLRANSGLLLSYFETRKRQFWERENSDHRGVPPTNPYGRSFVAFQEYLMSWMAERTIRAWHYTRMTDSGVHALATHGPVLSDVEGIRRRLHAQVLAGTFSSEIAERLWAASPFHKQDDIRSGQFWMVSTPAPTDSGGVELLLQHWGGESVYFWQQEPELVSLLQSIGRPRIVELTAPLSACAEILSFTAAGAVISSFAKSIGAPERPGGFDFCVVRQLGPEAVRAIHTDGESAFHLIGRGYPERFKSEQEDA
jgi:hypothetical protein